MLLGNIIDIIKAAKLRKKKLESFAKLTSLNDETIDSANKLKADVSDFQKEPVIETGNLVLDHIAQKQKDNQVLDTYLTIDEYASQPKLADKVKDLFDKRDEYKETVKDFAAKTGSIQAVIDFVKGLFQNNAKRFYIKNSNKASSLANAKDALSSYQIGGSKTPILKAFNYLFDYFTYIGAKWLSGDVSIDTLNDTTTELFSQADMQGIKQEDLDTGKRYQFKIALKKKSKQILQALDSEESIDIQNLLNIYDKAVFYNYRDVVFNYNDIMQLYKAMDPSIQLSKDIALFVEKQCLN